MESKFEMNCIGKTDPLIGSIALVVKTFKDGYSKFFMNIIAKWKDMQRAELLAKDSVSS